jgi:hypothetical protein
VTECRKTHSKKNASTARGTALTLSSSRQTTRGCRHEVQQHTAAHREVVRCQLHACKGSPTCASEGQRTGMGARWGAKHTTHQMLNTCHTALVPLKLATVKQRVCGARLGMLTLRGQTRHSCRPHCRTGTPSPWLLSLPLSPPSLPSPPSTQPPRLPLKIGLPKGQRLQQCVNGLIPSS